MFCIRLAEITLEIDNRHNYVYEQCADYLCTDGLPVFRVAVSTADTETYISSCGRPMTHPEAESYLIYRRICEIMPAYGVFLLHASVVEMGGRGYAFCARRGTGKTTHTELWENRFSGHAGARYAATVINGDKPLVRRSPDGRFWAYGTPWRGKEGKGVNRKCPLTAICFLEQGVENLATPALMSDTVARLLQSTVVPDTTEGQDQLASLIGSLARDIPAVTLTCRPDAEAVEVAYELLSQL